MRVYGGWRESGRGRAAGGRQRRHAAVLRAARPAARACPHAAATPADTFLAAQDLEPAPFLGDAWFFRTLAALGADQGADQDASPGTAWVRLVETQAGDPLPPLAASLPVSYQAVFEASTTFFLVGDVERGVPRYGDRWYRMQHIECGLLAERICLVAAALGLGSHLRCDYEADGVGRAFGLAAPAQAPLAMVLAGPPRQPRPLHVPLIPAGTRSMEARR